MHEMIEHHHHDCGHNFEDPCSCKKALYEAKDRGRNQVVSANHMLAVEKDKIAVLYATS